MWWHLVTTTGRGPFASHTVKHSVCISYHLQVIFIQTLYVLEAYQWWFSLGLPYNHLFGRAVNFCWFSTCWTECKHETATGWHNPHHVKHIMSFKSTAWQIHNIKIYQIVTNLLNSHETYKTENKAVELGKFHCVWMVMWWCAWDFVHWACTRSAHVTVNSAIPSSWYSAIGSWCSIASCVVTISKIWILWNISQIPNFQCLDFVKFFTKIQIFL